MNLYKKEVHHRSEYARTLKQGTLATNLHPFVLVDSGTTWPRVGRLADTLRFKLLGISLLLSGESWRLRKICEFRLDEQNKQIGNVVLGTYTVDRFSGLCKLL
jgi:hypothetical protein